MEEFMNHLSQFAAAYIIIGSVSGFFLKVYFFDIRGNSSRLKHTIERIVILETQLSDNDQGDVEREKHLSDRLTGVENSINKFEKALKAILKHLKIPDML